MEEGTKKTTLTPATAPRPSMQPIELKWVVGERELKEARLIAQEAKRAWQEEHDARIEAEEAKEAVVRAAEDAIAESAELKKKLSRELDEARQKMREATQARKTYEEAKAQTEQAKTLWREAWRLRNVGRPDDRLVVEAQEAEHRAEYILKWVE